METTLITQSPLNEIQQHLLQLFTFNKREEGLKEMKSVLFNYYQDKLKLQTRTFWENNQFDAAKMKEIMYGHNRKTTK